MEGPSIARLCSVHSLYEIAWYEGMGGREKFFRPMHMKSILCDQLFINYLIIIYFFQKSYRKNINPNVGFSIRRFLSIQGIKE